MKITINQNENQNIKIGNNNTQNIGINNSDDNQIITLSNNLDNQNIDINQNENQTIYVDGGGVSIGINDVLVNGISVVSNNIAYVIVPTKTSELQNDSGYITSETDPTVPSIVKTITLADINNWNNKQDSLVSGSNIKTINNTSLLGSGNLNIVGVNYIAGNGIEIIEDTINNTITSYNDLTDLPTIPTKVSDLINDSDYVSENELSEVAFTGSYSSLSDTPIIPEATSELVNDSGFINNTELTTALNTKQDTLVSGTNIKTINNNSLLGAGDITIQGVLPANVAYNNINNNFSANQSINGDLEVIGNVSQLKRATTGRWIDGRDESVIKQLGLNSAGLRALGSVKTQNGDWTIGNVYGGEELWFGYTTDTDYNNDNNVVSPYYISPDGYTNLQLNDSGYQTLSNGVNYRKVGNVVYIDCICNGTITVGDGNYTTIATLPTGYIPVHNIMFTWNTYGGNLNNQSAFVNTLGEINLYLPSGQTARYFGFSLSYVV